MQIKRLRFSREEDNSWYIDLPEWKGRKSDLLMVAGAESLLEYLAGNNDHVELNVSEEPFEDSEELKFQGLATDIGNGAYYVIEKYKGMKIDFQIWLCDVTKHVLGRFPERLYVAIADKNQ